MTAPVSSRETGIRVAVRSAVDVFDFVDQVDRTAVGELVVRAQREGHEVQGVVYVERGRVCWAAARGLARRLTDLLLARASGVDGESMAQLFRRCQEERIPLGEFLVAQGIVQAGDLRAALLEHTAESLDSLCGGDAEAGWAVRPGLSYCPRFTFSTSELLARSVARTLSPGERVMASEVAELLPETFAEGEGEWGAAFVRGASATPSPVVVHGAIPETTTDVLKVGKWAASALDLASTFQSEDALVTAIEDSEPSADGSVFVAWRHAGSDAANHQAIIAGRMKPQGPARILNQRARARVRRNGR